MNFANATTASPLHSQMETRFTNANHINWHDFNCNRKSHYAIVNT